MFHPLSSGRSSRLRLPLPLPLPTGGKRGGDPRERRPFRGPLAALEALAVNWSEFLGVVRLAGRLPRPLPGLSSSPLSLPGIVSDVPGGISSVTGVAPGDREDAVQSKDALEIVLDPGPSFYSLLLLVEKVTGDWRPVIDLSHLNGFVCLTPALLSVREGDFLASIDLKDSYFEIPVHPSSRKLLRFLLEGTVYQSKALCFGLSAAP